MGVFRVCGGATVWLLASINAFAQAPKDYQTRQNLFSVKVPAAWTVVERYASDERMQQKNLLVDFVGDTYPSPNTHDPRHALAVAITVRSTSTEGDSLHEYIEDYLAIAGGPPGSAFKPYSVVLFFGGTRTDYFLGGPKTYYSVDRLVKPFRQQAEVIVGGEKGVAFTFDASVHTLVSSTFVDDFQEHKARLKQALVKHGSDIVVFTLNSFEVVFQRDQPIFDKFLASVRWGHAE